MVTKSKLKLALAAEKGVDFKKLKQKKREKEALKRKSDKNGGAMDVDAESEEEQENPPEDEDSEIDNDLGGVILNEAEEADTSDEEGSDLGDGDIGEHGIDFEALNDSETSESEVELEAKIPRTVKVKQTPRASKQSRAPPEDSEDEDEDDEDDEDIPMSDLEDLGDEDREDLIPHNKLTINNKTALIASLKRICIPTDSSVPFATHQIVTSTTVTADSIPDVSDDLQRELALLSQSLEAARKARTLLRAEGVPFTRPNDYFAEMIKNDEQMEKVKAKLIEEASAKKASAEARKMRDLKKFGKQVQVAKLQERQKAKKDTLEKIKVLKKKRQENPGTVGANEADLFDVGVDNELKQYSNSKAGSGRGRLGEHASHGKRQKKNEKYGFGGKKRHSKSGDATSSADMSGFDVKRMKGVAKGRVAKTRPGKNRRKSMGK